MPHVASVAGTVTAVYNFIPIVVAVSASGIRVNPLIIAQSVALFHSRVTTVAIICAPEQIFVHFWDTCRLIA